MNKDDKTIIIRGFTPDEWGMLKAASDINYVSLNSYCKRVLMASVIKPGVIPVKRDNKGKFIR